MVIRASISLHADTTYVVPVAAVDYVDLVVSAELDASGRFRIIFDTYAVVDGFSFVTSKPAADTIGFSDTNSQNTTKALTDDFELQDSVATLLVFLRTLDDSAETADANTAVFQAGIKAETIGTADTRSAAYAKAISDGVAMNDESEAVDGSVHEFSKGVSNVVFTADADSLIFTTSRVESTSVADAGLLSMQSYCDLSYFAEDYVGVSQIF
jgi:hypothetical protein